MIVDDCPAYQKQKNIESDIFFPDSAGRVCSFKSPICDFDKFGTKVTPWRLSSCFCTLIILISITHNI